MDMTDISPRRDRQLVDPFVLAVIDWVRCTLQGQAGAKEARGRLDALRPGSRLDHMSRIFGLAPVEEDLIIFALAHRIDGGVAELCASASGDPRQTYVTAQLLTRTVGQGDLAFAAALFAQLAPRMPLRNRMLVEMRETHPLAALALNEEVALRLATNQSGIGFATLPTQALVARLESEARTLTRTMSQGLALIGPAGSGRRTLAARVAQMAGLKAVTAEGAQDLKALARDAWLDGLVLVADLDPGGGQRQYAASDEASITAREGAETRAWARQAAPLFGDRLILLAEDATGLPTKMHRERVAPLNAAERCQVWQNALPNWNAAERDAVARHFPVGPGVISAIAEGLDPKAPPGALWRRCRERGGQGIEALATRIVPRFGWSDLVVPDSIRRDLRAIVNQMRHRALVYDDWGFSERLSSGRGITAMFAGSSGTGKTMAAEVIAGELGLDLYKVDLSRLVSKYIGETEKNLRRVFDAAEETGACLFLDEADAVLGKRSEVKDSHDRHANIEVSYLLQRIESYSGLCLLATNLKNNVDAAFLRRLRFIVDIPFPDQGDRLHIWKGAFPPDVPTDGLDFNALARLDITGGSIVVIAVNAAFLAAAEGVSVGMDHIAQAARGEYRKHDRSFRASWNRRTR